jgi:hypothetical protein
LAQNGREFREIKQAGLQLFADFRAEIAVIRHFMDDDEPQHVSLSL